MNMNEDKNFDTETVVNTEEVSNSIVEDTEKTQDIANVETDVALTPEQQEMQAKIEDAKKDAKWYVLHTFSGYENVAKENLEIVIEKYNLQLRIFDIVIPMEDVVEDKNGKKKIVSRKVMPGYIFVKMIYGDDI